MKTVGSYEAKTHLPRLLDEVAQGQEITITRHGKPVAMLVPVGDPGRVTRAEAIAALRTFGKGITTGDMTVREMIEEGRR